MVKSVKKYKNPSAVSGKSVEEILDLSLDDFNQLTEKTLRQLTTRLVSAGNKRIKRLEKSNIYSPSYEAIKDSGGKFSVKGKSLNELKSEFIRLKNFFGQKTSTVTGAKEVRNTVISNLKKEGVNISEEQYNRVFRVYEELKRHNPEIANKAFKYRTLSEITRNDHPEDIEKMISDMEKKLNTIYEEEMGEINIDEFSSLFNLGSNL